MSKLDVLKVRNEILKAQVQMLEKALSDVVIPDCDSCPTHIPKAGCEGNFYRTKVPNKVLEQEVARRVDGIKREIYHKIREKFESLQSDQAITTNFRKYVGCDDCEVSGKHCSNCYALLKFTQNQTTLFLLEE